MKNQNDLTLGHESAVEIGELLGAAKPQDLEGGPPVDFELVDRLLGNELESDQRRIAVENVFRFRSWREAAAAQARVNLRRIFAAAKPSQSGDVS